MKVLLTLLLLVLLLGCGASQPTDEAALAQYSHATAASQAAPRSALLKVSASSATRLSAVPPAITAIAFLDWAERTFPAFFPSPAQSVALSGFVLRYYPGSLIYLGVRDDGAIYALGPVTDNQVVALGTLADFACLVASCLPPEPAPTGNVVGPAGIAAWDTLAADQKARVTTSMRSFFLHQSVDGDLEGGAQAIGFKFEYTDSRATSLAAVSALKAQGVRVLHVTPPLVYNAPDENTPKLQMRTWMLSTFAQDTVFDLQDLASTDPTSGARCERGGAWEICDAVRATATCPSLNQGVDAPSGQGHLCFNPHAQRFAKALLYAIYRAQL